MYAPVSVLAIRETGDQLTGYAAPAGGPAPCLLRLMADDVPVAAARATRFSAEARTKSIRLGWCGFSVPGLAMAAAIGTDLKVRCGATDRILWHRKAHAPIAAPSGQSRPLTVFEILALSRAEDEAPGLAEIRPILRQHLSRLGVGSFVNATYETFLGRSAERGVADAFSRFAAEDVIDTATATVLNSEEYGRNALRFLPGPFNAAFRYDLAALDGG